MQGQIRSCLVGMRRSPGQVPPDKVDNALPIAAAKPDQKQMLHLLEDSWQDYRSPLNRYRSDDEIRMHDSPTRGCADGRVWNGYISRRSFGSAAESIHTPIRLTFRIQKPELRSLGRKFLTQSRPDDGESNFHKLGHQAWHVGTALLIVNQDLKARRYLSESIRTLSEWLAAILKLLHPNAKKDPHLQCKSITRQTCDDTEEIEEKTAKDKEIKRTPKMRRKRKEKGKPETPAILSDPVFPGQG